MVPVIAHSSENWLNQQLLKEPEITAAIQKTADHTLLIQKITEQLAEASNNF